MGARRFVFLKIPTGSKTELDSLNKSSSSSAISTETTGSLATDKPSREDTLWLLWFDISSFIVSIAIEYNSATNLVVVYVSLRACLFFLYLYLVYKLL